MIKLKRAFDTGVRLKLKLKIAAKINTIADASAVPESAVPHVIQPPEFLFPEPMLHQPSESASALTMGASQVS